MMRMRAVSYHGVIVLFLLAHVAGAAVHEDAGTRPGTFLKIDPTARVAGMAGAYTAVDGEADCAFMNPAGLADMRAPQVITSLGSWLADTKYGTLNVAFPAGRLAGAALTYTYLDYGVLTRVRGQDAYGVPLEDGSFSARDMALGVSYAREFSIRRFPVRIGATLKGTRLAIDADDAAGWAYDTGMMVPVGRGTVLGVSLRNAGSQDNAAGGQGQLPQETAVGLSRRMLVGGQGDLLLAVDAAKAVDAGTRVRAGVEYGFHRTLFLRAGYKGNYDAEAFTAGIGIAYALARIDYAFVPFSALGDTHRISCSVRFGGPAGSGEHDRIAVSPVRLNVAARGPLGAALGWQCPNTVKPAMYGIFLSTDGFHTLVPIPFPPGARLTEPYATLNALAAHTDYWVKITAYNARGQLVGASDPVHFRTGAGVPGPVVNFNGKGVSMRSIEWTWRDVPRATVYRIYDADTRQLKRTVATGTQMWREEGLRSGSSYRRTIVAVNAYGEGPLSLAVVASPLTESEERARRLQDIVRTISFDTGSYTVRTEDVPALNRLSEYLILNGSMTVCLEGYADTAGDAIADRVLSVKRAKSVRNYLIIRGVDQNKVLTRSRSVVTAVSPRAPGGRMECVVIEQDGSETRAR